VHQILACPKCEGPEIQKNPFFLNIFTHVAAPFLADEQAHMFYLHSEYLFMSIQLNKSHSYGLIELPCPYLHPISP
jgi:hypothetical protein